MSPVKKATSLEEKYDRVEKPDHGASSPQKVSVRRGVSGALFESYSSEARVVREGIAGDTVEASLVMVEFRHDSHLTIVHLPKLPC